MADFIPDANRGRYAPSPSGDLHLGNLRTAVLAYACARTSGRGFVLRVDDIDAQRSSAAAAERQLADLAALGIEWEGDVARQRSAESLARYGEALDRLRDQGLVYECYCSRKDIRAAMEDASRAPHGLPGAYPGTCRDLSPEQREHRRAELAAQGRVPALRLRSEVSSWQVSESFFMGDP